MGKRVLCDQPHSTGARPFPSKREAATISLMDPASQQSGYLDTFAADNLPPRDQWPIFLTGHPAFVYPERLNCVSFFLDRWVDEAQGDRLCLIDEHGKPSPMRAQARVNRLCNVLIAPARPARPATACCCAPANSITMAPPISPSSRRAASSSRPCRCFAPRKSPIRSNKAKIALALCDQRLADEMEAARALAPGLNGSSIGAKRGPDSLEALMASTRARDFDGRRHRRRRRLPDRLHLRHHRRAEGHDALPPRHAGDLRRLRANMCCAPSRPTVSSARRRSPSPSASADCCCFRCGSAHDRRCWKAPGRTICLPRDRPVQGHHLLHRADRLSRDARRRSRTTIFRRSARCVSAGETLAASDLRRLARGDRHQADRRHRRHRDAAHLHQLARGRESAPARPAGRCPATRPGSSTTTADVAAARHGGAPRRARPDRLPLSRRRAADKSTCATAGTVTGDTYLIDDDGYFWYQARSDDMIVSAGYNIAGPGGGGGAAAAPGGRRMRGRRRARRGARHDRESLCGAAPPGVEPTPRDLAKALQDHVEARDRALQISARDRVRRRLPKTHSGKLQRFELRKRAETE